MKNGWFSPQCSASGTLGLFSQYINITLKYTLEVFFIFWKYLKQFYKYHKQDFMFHSQLIDFKTLLSTRQWWLMHLIPALRGKWRPGRLHRETSSQEKHTKQKTGDWGHCAMSQWSILDGSSSIKSWSLLTNIIFLLLFNGSQSTRSIALFSYKVLPSTLFEASLGF